MRVLVLGGTRFIGRHLVEAAQAAGHQVDVFSRGRTPAPAGAHHRIGDRNGDLTALDDDRWDVVVDVSGYLPRQVRATAARLTGRAGRYLFISSCAVYDGNGAAELAEDAPLRELPDPTVEEITGATYGGLKVLCERAAEASFEGSVLSVRPTFVVGPYDNTDRFTSWLRRVRRGGHVAAPYDPELPIAFIDVRDLARFLVRLCEGDATGAVNASGPDRPTAWGETLDLAREVTGSDADFTWLPADFLRGRGADRDAFPMAAAYPFRGAEPYATARARELGLTYTDVAATIRDTLAWHDLAGEATAGLSDVDEADLLRAWDARHLDDDAE
jgi:2'-hydroxyisoflavone reductase